MNISNHVWEQRIISYYSEMSNVSSDVVLIISPLKKHYSGVLSLLSYIYNFSAFQSLNVYFRKLRKLTSSDQIIWNQDLWLLVTFNSSVRVIDRKQCCEFSCEKQYMLLKSRRNPNLSTILTDAELTSAMSSVRD